MPASRKIAPHKDTTLARREAVIEAFTELVLSVPEATAGDIADLLGPLVGATDWESLNTTDGLPSSKTLVGVKLRVDSVSRKPSDKPTKTGFYLLCEGFNVDTGEAITWTAGGEQAVAVHAKLRQLGAMPAYVQYASVMTSSGNPAINCTVLGVDPSRVIDG